MTANGYPYLSVCPCPQVVSEDADLRSHSSATVRHFHRFTHTHFSAVGSDCRLPPHEREERESEGGSEGGRKGESSGVVEEEVRKGKTILHPTCLDLCPRINVNNVSMSTVLSQC